MQGAANDECGLGGVLLAGRRMHLGGQMHLKGRMCLKLWTV